MSQPKYRFYATLLDSFYWFLNSESETAEQEFIDKINRVPITDEKALERMNKGGSLIAPNQKIFYMSFSYYDFSTRFSLRLFSIFNFINYHLSKCFANIQFSYFFKFFKKGIRIYFTKNWFSVFAKKKINAGVLNIEKFRNLKC